VFCLVIIASASATAEVVVEEVAFCASSRYPIISATESGHSVEGARIDIYREIEHGERLAWTGTTDQQGVARSSELEIGSYHVLAYSRKLSAEMRLGISNKSEGPVTCELKFVPPINEEQRQISAEQQQKDRLAALIKNAPSIQLKEFRGLVQDRGNAIIQGLKIEVLRKGDLAKGNVAEALSNQKGQFELPLDRGDYVAIFTYRGFQTRAIVVEIGSEGWSGVRIAMSVGASPSPANAPPQEWDPEQ
jgi:hypothetical protein